MRRKELRLSESDYSLAGAYFITICTAKRAKILSNICSGDPCGRPILELSPLGMIADKAFKYVEELYDVKFDYKVIMPDHIHFVVFLNGNKATTRVATTVGRVVGAYKSYISNERRKLFSNPNEKMWQSGYYDHIIRNEADLNEIRQYIENNPISYFEKHLQKDGED